MKMSCDSLSEWMHLHDEQMQKIWQAESRELRKIAMLHYAYRKEVERLKDVMEDEFSQIKSVAKRREGLNKMKKFKGLAQSEKLDLDIINVDSEDEETNIFESAPLTPQDLNEVKTEGFIIESPDTEAFRSRTPSLEPPEVTAMSPILHKNSFTKPTRKNLSSPGLLMSERPSISEKKNASGPSTINWFTREKTQESPEATSKRKKPNNLTRLIIPKVDDSNSKENYSNNPSSGIPGVRITQKIEINSELKPKTGSFNDSNIMESSIIEDTPERPLKRKRKEKVFSFKLRTKQNNTLTQNFLQVKPIEKVFDSKLSSMGVTQMLNYINEPDPELDRSDETLDGLEECSKIGDETPEMQSINEEENPRAEFVEEPQMEINQKGGNVPRPREETYDGFWDLTFGLTPKSQEEESMVLK